MRYITPYTFPFIDSFCRISIALYSTITAQSLETPHMRSETSMVSRLHALLHYMLYDRKTLSTYNAVIGPIVYECNLVRDVKYDNTELSVDTRSS